MSDARRSLASAFDPGRVRLSWRPATDRGERFVADVECRRPAVVDHLRGLPADRAVALVATLYAICGAAQSVASWLALAAARGVPTPPRNDPAVAAEAAREHAWRLQIDWPDWLGLGVDRAASTAFMRGIIAGQRPSWSIPDWIDALPADDVVPQLLPSIDAEDSVALITTIDASFVAAPRLQGIAAETGAHARRGGRDGSGLRGRVRARAIELAAYLSGDEPRIGRASAIPLGPATGRAVVETARGMLVHEIELDAGRIARYAILSPTDWNFQPGGPLVRGLEAVDRSSGRGAAGRADDEPPHTIRAWVLALDPCVTCEVERVG